MTHVERLLYRYAAGDAVVAVLTIVYDDGHVVAEGERGTVERPRYRGVAGLALVHWPCLGCSKQTSQDSVEPTAPDPSPIV